MRVRSHLNVAQAIEDVAAAQAGYFTRAQASAAQVADYQLQRAVEYGQVHRLDHGVYRVAGAGQDEFQELRTLWLRLDPVPRPRERTRKPTLWVSHASAAWVHSLGVLVPTVYEFTSTTRRQLRTPRAQVVRSAGLGRHEWMVREGFAVTSPLRTLADLDRAGIDGGHLGVYIDAALTSGVARRTDIDAMSLSHTTDAFLAMADKSGTG